jgi:hypothetical protein
MEPEGQGQSWFSPIFLLLLVDHREQSLSSTAFKQTISNIVKDLAGLSADMPTRCVYFEHKI